MRPIEFDGMNKIFTSPHNWDESTMGVCRDLPVKAEPGQFTSCYELDSDDIDRLIHGGKLWFTIYQNTEQPHPVVGWNIE